MNTIKKVAIDFQNPLYQQHINAVLGANAELRHIAIIDLQSEAALHAQGLSLTAEIQHDIDCAASFFTAKRPPPPTSSAAMDFLVLRFAADYLIAYPEHTFGQAFAVIPSECSGLENALQIACSDQPPTDLGEEYFYDLTKTNPPCSLERDNGSALAAFCQWPGSSPFLQAVTCGHWLPEKAPASVTDALRQLYFCRKGHCIHCLRSRFLPNYLTILVHDNHSPLPDQLSVCRMLEDGILRTVIEDILAAGIVTDTTLVADTASAERIVEQLAKLDYDDLYGLLEVGGFANHSLGEQGEMEDGRMIYRCAECIYYHPNRKWCDLPELPVPVEAHWYCKLWRL